MRAEPLTTRVGSRSSITSDHDGIELPPPLIETIAWVAASLSHTRDPWWIIAGAAAALHGAHPIAVSDVDVLLSVEDADAVFARFGITRAPRSDHPRFRSERFGRWTGCALPVEFMADFSVRSADGIWRVVRPASRQAITIGAATVYVPDLADLRTMFESFGRPKDLTRIALIDDLSARGPRPMG